MAELLTRKHVMLWRVEVCARTHSRKQASPPCHLFARPDAICAPPSMYQLQGAFDPPTYLSLYHSPSHCLSRSLDSLTRTLALIHNAHSLPDSTCPISNRHILIRAPRIWIHQAGWALNSRLQTLTETDGCGVLGRRKGRMVEAVGGGDVQVFVISGFGGRRGGTGLFEA